MLHIAAHLALVVGLVGSQAVPTGVITYSHGDDVWVARADGTDPRRLTHRSGAEFDPSWSPDGKRIVYRDSRRGLNNNDEIYVMRSDGTRRRNLTRSPGDEWSPSWSPDGRWIAYYAGQLFVMHPDGTDKHAVTEVEGEYPTWSPDGKRIAFMSAYSAHVGAPPDYEVFVVDRDGSHLRRVTNWQGEDGWPAWSPDGMSIAFTSTHEAGSRGRYTLYVMAADGSHKRRLTRTVSGEFPVWSPDGKLIMFTGSRHGLSDDDPLWVIRPDGTGLRRLPLRGWLADWRR